MGCGPSATAPKDEAEEAEQLPRSAAKATTAASRGASGAAKDAGGVGEVGIKSAILIQKWYRRYKARLEARRRTTWMIYQSIEYSSEASQLQLYNFFNDMLRLAGDAKEPPASAASLCFAERLRQKSIEEEDQELLEQTQYSDLTVEKSYDGPQLTFPLGAAHVQLMIDAFRHGRQLHSRFLLQLLHETRQALKAKPNILEVSTGISKQITVVGDLHGKLEDLLVVFYKNGLPDVTNPYIFNGDFVDRGHNSIEIAALLFACQLVWPTAVCVNRGNHEDHVMNYRYGFIKEVQNKYRHAASRVVKLFGDVFAWLPLAAVIDDTIFVAHGGISDKLDLEKVRRLERHRYLSPLRPPVSPAGSGDSNKIDYVEWRQVLDLLWSDPKPQAGCRPNSFRGGGCYFGPDITKSFLERNGFSLLVRSHECKQDGWEFAHNDQVLTIFSASNYYEEGSNRGAYVKFDAASQPHIVQYMASKARKLPVGQRLSSVEENALKDLRARIVASKCELVEAFERLDPRRSGCVTISQWCDAMQRTLRLELPWRTLRPHLAQVGKDGALQYMSTFKRGMVKSKLSSKEVTGSISEAVYKNKEELETIFRIIDKDSSGQISLDEFKESCAILCQATQRHMSEEEVASLAKSLDLNSDGFIDFNEFLEAFRIVDYQRQESERRLGGAGANSADE